MIKIAFVINYLIKNGPSSVILNIINNLNRNKYDIGVITLFPGNDTDIEQVLNSNNVELYKCKTLTRKKCLIGRDNEFSSYLQENKFDIVHSHGYIPDLLSSRLSFPIKKISTLHNNMYEDYLDTYGFLKSRFLINHHLKILKKMDLCVCCSKSVFDAMNSELKNSIYIRNGIENPKSSSNITRDKLDLPEEAKVFIYIGKLNIRKNVLWLIREFVKYRGSNDYLLILGDGDKKEECVQAADDHVLILGFCHNPIAYVKISDFYISASRSEGFSISVLEALSQGLGLFLSDIPSHKEVFEIREEIYLGEIYSEDGFAEKLRRLENNHIEKVEIQEFYKEELSASNMSKKYMSVYEKSING